MLIFSRRYYDWDFTAGLAWGNAGSRGDLENPFCKLMERFCTRSQAAVGEFSTNFFRGERVSVFGGVEYQSPIDGLRLKVELDGNDYQDEPLGNVFDVAMPINFGVEYDVFNSFRISAALERGSWSSRDSCRSIHPRTSP